MESIQHIEYVAARDAAAQRALEDAEFIDELALAVEAVKFEVNEYLFNEKYAANQQSIDFEVGADAPFPGCEEEVGRIVDNDTGEVTPIKGKRKSKVA